MVFPSCLVWLVRFGFFQTKTNQTPRNRPPPALPRRTGHSAPKESVEWIDLGGAEALLRGWHQGPRLAQARAGCAACFGPDGCVPGPRGGGGQGDGGGGGEVDAD